jgi:FkbM family methyltransferase
MPTHSHAWGSRTIRKLSHWLGYQWRVTRRPVIGIEGVQIRVGRHMSRRVEQALSKGSCERDELQLIGLLLSPDDVVLEIGAGLGLVSAFCAKRIGSDRVFAFEADPDLEPCIRETYQLNGVEPFLEICAVTARAGRVTLRRDQHFISASVVRRRAGAQPVEVPGKALNYVVARLQPTLLVVDPEAANPDLFDQAELPTVSRILLEAHDRVIGPRGTGRVIARLGDMGFQVHRGISSPDHLVLRRTEPGKDFISDLSHRKGTPAQLHSGL